MSSSSKSEMENKFICIHCGHPVAELYKNYSPSVLKIMNCKNCGEIADKYIEFEPTIVAIDLILLYRPAYNHLLYNTQFKNHWKLLVVILLLESYILYRAKAEPTAGNNAEYTMEKLFYMCFGSVLMENIILLLLLRLTLMFTRIVKLAQDRHNERQFQLILIKSMTIAHVAKFFQLPILIWNKNTSELAALLNYSLVVGYIVLALTHVYSVISHRGRRYSAIVIICILLVKSQCTTLINRQLFSLQQT